MPRIRIKIKNGITVIEGEGFVGRKCDVLQELGQKIGKIQNVTYHAEYYIEPQLKEDVYITTPDSDIQNEGS